IDKITFENASRFFGWDPFAHIPREQATVGALRAKAADVDISETSKTEYRRRYELANS
ncbi:amidohydrolase, partial [Rhodococcus sp. CC-R104]|nr:amidohydrolase [Rhodococcus sp. CC-R104]